MTMSIGFPNPLRGLLGLAVAAVVWFAVVKPVYVEQRAAVEEATRQSEHALRQSDRRTKALLERAERHGATIPRGVARAQKLADCMAAAGTDTARIQACATR